MLADQQGVTESGIAASVSESNTVDGLQKALYTHFLCRLGLLYNKLTAHVHEMIGTTDPTLIFIFWLKFTTSHMY